MAAAHIINFATELQEEILWHLYTPVDTSNPNRTRETAINRAALKAYGQTCHRFALVARRHLFAAIALDITPSRRGGISQLEQDLDNFADLLEASIAFDSLGMVYHMQSLTMHISTPAAANLFLENKRIQRILRVLLPWDNDKNAGKFGVEFIGILARTTLSYQELFSETEILQRIVGAKRIKHVLLRGLEDIPDQLLENLRSRAKTDKNFNNLEIYECSTMSGGPVESMGWEAPGQLCYFDAKSLDILQLVNAVPHFPPTLKTLRIHLPAVLKVRFTLIPNAPSTPPTPLTPESPEIPLHLFHKLTKLTFLHITQTSTPGNVVRQFLPYLSRCRFPPSLTTLKLEIRTKVVLNSTVFSTKHLKPLDTLLLQPRFVNIANITIAVECHLVNENDNGQPVCEARRRQVRLRIEEEMTAGLPQFLQVDQILRRRRFDISVEETTPHAKARIGGRKQLVVPFFEPAP